MSRRTNFSFVNDCLRYAIVLSMVVMMLSCRNDQKDIAISDQINLAADNKQAMGGFVFKDIATKSFAITDFNYNNNSFSIWYKKFIDETYKTTHSVYFIIAPAVLTYKEEAQAMEEYVSNGNTVFIASNTIDGELLQTFGLSIDNDIAVTSPNVFFKMRDTQKTLTDSISFPQHRFSFFFYPCIQTIAVDSNVQHEVLGLNDYGNPDFVRVKHGKGELIVMANAQACTNYFLLTKNNVQYALAACSYLPEQPSNLYWDDFYRKHNYRSPAQKSTLSTILSIPQLRYAFFILLALVAIWIVTHFFRRQKAIPVIAPVNNSSKEFTQTIARLYLSKKDNRNIALKVIAHLQDHLRNKYYLHYTGINDEFSNILATKTGLPSEKTEALVQTIRIVQENSTVSDETLLQLNAQVQEITG